jgi:anti-anti-sigma regulatory factor
MENIKQTETEIKLHLDKSLTIQNAITLKEQFEKAITSGDTIIIDHNDAEEFDLSYLQLLLSLDQYAVEIGKKIRYIGNHPDSFEILLKNTGLSLENWQCESNHSSENNGRKENG